MRTFYFLLTMALLGFISCSEERETPSGESVLTAVPSDSSENRSRFAEEVATYRNRLNSKIGELEKDIKDRRKLREEEKDKRKWKDQDKTLLDRENVKRNFEQKL